MLRDAGSREYLARRFKLDWHLTLWVDSSAYYEYY